MIKLREFLPKDLEQVLEISKKSFSRVWPKNGFEKNYHKHPDEFIVADDDGRVAGFILGKIANNQGVIKLVAVSPDYRGKGVGKSLMERIFSHFKEKGMNEITAHSRMHNEEGCTFLKSFGFEIVKTLENYYLNGENAYLMIKKLDD